MAEFIVVKVPLDQDLGEFSRYLWQQNVPHRIISEDEWLLLLVGSENDAQQVSRAWQVYLHDRSALPEIRREEDQLRPRLVEQLLQVPVTSLLLVLSVLGFLLVEFDPDFSVVKLFTFFEFERRGNTVVFHLPDGEYWRMITPIFLHFGLLHIAFNALWLWDLGRRIEMLQGSVRMVGIVMVMALGSNIAQTLYAKVSVFGGMSGVIYGLLGYGWLWSVLCPQHSLGIPRVVIGFMLGWLVLCMLGAASLLGAGAVANAAHVGGLLMGMILGTGAGLIARASGHP